MRLSNKKNKGIIEDLFWSIVERNKNFRTFENVLNNWTEYIKKRDYNNRFEYFSKWIDEITPSNYILSYDYCYKLIYFMIEEKPKKTPKECYKTVIKLLFNYMNEYFDKWIHPTQDLLFGSRLQKASGKKTGWVYRINEYKMLNLSLYNETKKEINESYNRHLIENILICMDNFRIYKFKLYINN